MPWTVEVFRDDLYIDAPNALVKAVYKKSSLTRDFEFFRVFDPDDAGRRADFVSDAVAAAQQFIITNGDDKADAQQIDADLTAALP